MRLATRIVTMWAGRRRMHKLDQFAAAALATAWLTVNAIVPKPLDVYAAAAREAYRLAEAMLTEHERRRGF